MTENGSLITALDIYGKEEPNPADLFIEPGQTAYDQTGEYSGDYNELVYLRARMYAPGMGRFLAKDSWQGDYQRPLSLNRWNYTEENPINRTDPSGFFPKEMIWKNIPLLEFVAVEPASYPLRRDRVGFLALLLDAEEYDYMRSDYLDLVQFPEPPVISYSKTEQITTNCDTIMIGSKTLKEYYESEVRRQRSLGVRW